MSSLATPLVISTCTRGHDNPGAEWGEVTAPCIPKGVFLLCRNPWRSAPPKEQKKKQVKFNVEEDLDSDPTLPTQLTTFLVEGTAKEWDNAPSPSIPLLMDPLQPPHSGGHQHHTFNMGRAHPKVPLQPSAAACSRSSSQTKGMPDPVDYPDWWINAVMDRLGRHCCWWKEIRAIKQYTLGWHMIGNDLNEPEALYISQWQAAAFRPPPGWWDSPPSFCRQHTYDFLLHTDATGMRDFQTMRQQKTLILAWALQCCAEGLGAPTGVLCNMAWGLQKCMVPLMSQNGEDIVEASLLEPMGNEPKTSPNAGAGSYPPGERTGAPQGSRSYFTSPEMSRNSWVKGTNQANWHIQYPCPFNQADWCSKHPCASKTLSCPFPENKEIPVRDWAQKLANPQPKHHLWFDLILHQEV